MPIASTRPTLYLPSTSAERLEIRDCHVGGYPDPTALNVAVLISSTMNAERATAPEPDDDGWEVASWGDTTTTQTPLWGPATPGTYGVWWRCIVLDEVIIRWAGQAVRY